MPIAKLAAFLDMVSEREMIEDSFCIYSSLIFSLHSRGKMGRRGEGENGSGILLPTPSLFRFAAQANLFLKLYRM